MAGRERVGEERRGEEAGFVPGEGVHRLYNGFNDPSLLERRELPMGPRQGKPGCLRSPTTVSTPLPHQAYILGLTVS